MVQDQLPCIKAVIVCVSVLGLVPCIVIDTLASFGRSNHSEDNPSADNSGVPSQAGGEQPGLIQGADYLPQLLETVPTPINPVPVILPLHPPTSPPHTHFQFPPSESDCQLLGVERIPGRPFVSCPSSRGHSCSSATSPSVPVPA